MNALHCLEERAEQVINHINHKLEHIMAALDDLKAEVVALNTSFSNELTAINNKLASIQAGTSDADIQSVITDLKALQASIDAETDTLTTKISP